MVHSVNIEGRCLRLAGRYESAALPGLGVSEMLATLDETMQCSFLIVSSINVFDDSDDFLISFVGVAVFVLLTAADTQKIKQLGNQLIADRQTVDKVALTCALTLYLDFINLFLFLLRIMGKRRD